MAPPWLLVCLSAALCAHARPQDAEAQTTGASADPPGAAWGMGSLTVPMAIKRSPMRMRRPVSKRAADDTAGALVLPIEHQASPRLSRRAGESGVLNQELQARSDVSYYTTLRFGDPPQNVRVLVDTGSSELWINPICASSGSAADQTFCDSQVGRYQPEQSSTAESLGQQSSIRYGSGTVNMTYFTDQVALPGARAMQGVQFGVATSSSMESSGILGIAAGEGVTTKYKNFVDQLADQGLTASKSYSVGLGLKGEGAGSIVFGGVDTSKFVGRLRPQRIIPPGEAPDKFPRFWVRLEGISHSAQGQEGGSRRLANSSMPVILDTGSTLAILPTQLERDIAAELSAGEADQTGLRPVPCRLAEESGSFNFAFDSVVISVPYREMIRGQPGPSTGAGPAQRCHLGVKASDSLALLGDTFLRSAYAVFDIDGNNVYLAQYANCGSTPRTASSRDFADMQGRCSGRDASPDGSLFSELQQDTQSAAAGGLAPSPAAVAAVVGAVWAAAAWGL